MPSSTSNRVDGRGDRTTNASGIAWNGAGFVSRIGPLEVDWPRSLGFFGGIALAVGAGVIDPPLGLFIAAVPFLKMLDLPRLPERVRFVPQVLEGVAKPVGGDSEGTIRIITNKGASDEPVESTT